MGNMYLFPTTEPANLRHPQIDYKVGPIKPSEINGVIQSLSKLKGANQPQKSPASTFPASSDWKPKPTSWKNGCLVKKTHFLCKDLVRNHSIDSQTFINGWPSDHPTLAFPTFAGWSASAKGALGGKVCEGRKSKTSQVERVWYIIPTAWHFCVQTWPFLGGWRC